MSQMVRKQIYIQKSQDERLKKVVKVHGVSEAEIIRRALDNEIRQANVSYPLYDDEAMRGLVALWQELDTRGPVALRPRNWTREELYEDRMKRYDRNSD
ncbi:MAG TPA: ribbon-helix-helix protein, CopG family [Anaerolineales bacterium]|nr:ribbon-helix-helix protein, CopG family [Anaerolineales bacterium]